MSEPTEMELVVGADGNARCFFGAALNLRQLGTLQITRASHGEPGSAGNWCADIGPVGWPVLGPLGRRREGSGRVGGRAGAGGKVAVEDRDDRLRHAAR